MNPIYALLFYFVLPLWILAGIADYACHRRTRIEITSGVKEAQLHVLEAAQIGVALLAGLFLEINALVLALMIICVLAHTLTALWDAEYTSSRRFISPFEQHVHSHLEYLPIVAVLLVVLLNWREFLGLFGVGEPSVSWALRWKNPPVPWPYVVEVLVPVVAVQGALLTEELWRSARARQRAKAR